MPEQTLIIGISGVTCGGKTTIATALNEVFPKSRLISQDDYFLDVDDPRHVWIPELNHINFDILSSLDMEKMDQDIQEFLKNKNLMNISSECGQNTMYAETYLYDKAKTSNIELLIVEGFSIFNYEPLRNLFHFKYFFTLPKELCKERRNQRVYEPPDCPGYFEKCVWPEHLQQLEEVKKEVSGVKYFNEHTINPLGIILFDIINVIEQNQNGK